LRIAHSSVGNDHAVGCQIADASEGVSGTGAGAI